MHIFRQLGLLSGMLVLLFLATGCYEYSILTQVMDDGSLQRFFVVKGDPEIAMEFGMWADSSWQITQRSEYVEDPETGRDTMLVIEMRKSFPDAESLNREMMKEPIAGFHAEVSFQKEFKWFYDVYTYSETYTRNANNAGVILSRDQSVTEPVQFTYQVLMPGVITGTSADETNANLVTWHINTQSMSPEVFTMSAESRLFNRGLIVLTGTVIILLIVFIIFRRR